MHLEPMPGGHWLDLVLREGAAVSLTTVAGSWNEVELLSPQTLTKAAAKHLG